MNIASQPPTITNPPTNFATHGIPKTYGIPKTPGISGMFSKKHF
jgi:hypothetical protein